MKKILLLVVFLLTSLLAFNQSRITLAWNPSTDNVGVAGYCVWVDGVRYDSTENTQYEFPVLDAGEYDLTVSAYDAAGNESAQSEPLHAIIPDITQPAVPQIITVEYQQKSARVTWMEPQDNVGIVGYNIYLDGVFLDSTNTNRYEMNGLTPEEDYHLSISAYDAAGNESPRSSEFTIKLPIDEMIMSIYPNPSNGVFNIKLSNGTIKKNTYIQVISLEGRIMHQQPIPEGLPLPYVEQVDLRNIIREGTFIVSIIEDNIRTQSLRLIITSNILYQTKNNDWGLKVFDFQSDILPVFMKFDQNRY